MPARNTVLPAFVVTDLADASYADAIRVTVPKSSHTKGGRYFIRPEMIERESFRRDGKPAWVPHRFNLHPGVLDANGPGSRAWMYSLVSKRHTKA